MIDVPYSAFKFGYAEAEKESTYEPELLLDGFYDPGSVIEEARDGNRFLFLGYKGSGKSAISAHLRLLSEADSELFVTQSFLADFPYTDLKRLVRGDAEPEARYPTAWSWLLLLTLFNSFLSDEGANVRSNLEFARAADALRKANLIPSPSLREIVQVSAKRSFKLSIPKVFEATSEATSEQTSDLPFFVQRLRILASRFRSRSKHLLIIDGLDDILTAREAQYQSLAALVSEVARLNDFFHQSGTPAKIIVLCRTDLFERLPSANKNKLRQDSAVHLDWYNDPRQPDLSMLVRLANRRAALTAPKLNDLFSEYYPSEVDRQNAKTFLLDLTRHTPRDFLQALGKIQNFSGSGRLTRDQVLSGVRQYSIDYFLPEIRDELHGYVDRDSVDAAFELIGSLRTREFSFMELHAKAQSAPRFARLDLAYIVRCLFESSGIGNVQNRPTGTTYYTFKYRNRNSTLNLDERLTLHRGMWKAMNLV
jgi:hypothetical protein